jgi:type II secretory pathway pseudopilin PulG
LLLMLSIGLPRWQQHRAAVVAQAEQQRQQQLTADNALLEEVDQDVSQVVPDAMLPLSLNSSSTASGTSSTHGNAPTQQ